MAKLSILTSMPITIKRVFKALKKADIFQFRAPTSIGVYLIPLLTLLSGKKGWYKYAGNWVQKSPPLSYAFQRWFLAHCQRRKVTINGSWSNQPRHCISFENPCLRDREIKLGAAIQREKVFAPPYTLCFTGRLEDAKGVRRIIEALASHPNPELFKELQLVGDGSDREAYELMAKKCKVPIRFLGFLDRTQVFKVYQSSHIFLLPSTASEGFPKVIAEAASFGCVPIVSNVSSIPQYINHTNGFVWDSDRTGFSDYVNKIPLVEEILCGKSENILRLAREFTMEKYAHKIKKKIIHVE